MTFHVRLVSLPDRTSDLVQALAADVGVSNLLVLPGAAREPVRRRRAVRRGDPVRQLRVPEPADLPARSQRHGRRRVPRCHSRGEKRRQPRNIFWCSVTSRPSGTSLRPGSARTPSTHPSFLYPPRHRRADRRGRHPHQLADPYRRRHGRGAGIQRDHGCRPRHRQASQAAILRGLLALLAGFSAAIIVTLLFALAIRWSGHTPKLYSIGVRPVSSLIDSPNLFSIVVAVLAGIVGVVSLTEARASALIGVFISVTTIPAAADVGLSIGYGSWSEARGSAFQLLLNVVVLIAVGALLCAFSGSSGAPANGQNHTRTLRPRSPARG